MRKIYEYTLFGIFGTMFYNGLRYYLMETEWYISCITLLISILGLIGMVELLKRD